MSENQATSSDELSDPASWVDRHGDVLFRYALSRLRDRELAEDMVQETFLAALRRREQFAANSSERTWLVGILKHKIIDYFRRKARERALQGSDSVPHAVDALFDEKGSWKVPPSKGSVNPSTILEQKEFWNYTKQLVSQAALEACAVIEVHNAIEFC